MIKIEEIENRIRKEASTVLGRVILFLVYYIMLILIGISLFVAAFGITWLLLGLLSELHSINGRLLLWGGILWLAMWWFCLQIAWYLVKPLFSIHRASNENRREIYRSDCPELFSVIEDIASKTGNKMPKHVYLSAELNACVFYNSTSIWSIFLPTRKNLMVGIGLLQGMGKDELRAILAHEFGHFSQQTMKVGSITYRLTNDDCKVLKYCTDMVALHIGHNKVTDISFLQYMPDLRILILVDNWDGDTSDHYLSDLSYVKYCKKLMYLEFFVGDVTDLSVLADLNEMVDLNISYNPVSDITPLLNYPKLERLFLEHTNVSEADYELLKKTYPDAQIVLYGEGSVDQGWRTHPRYYAMKDMYVKNYVNDLFK